LIAIVAGERSQTVSQKCKVVYDVGFKKAWSNQYGQEYDSGLTFRYGKDAVY